MRDRLLLPFAVLGGAEDEDVRGGTFVWRDLLRVLEDGGGSLGVRPAEIFVFGFVGFGNVCEWGRDLRLLGLLKGLGEGCLAGSGSATIGSDLGPAFAEEIAELPACLYSRAQQFFVRSFPFPFVLP